MIETPQPPSPHAAIPAAALARFAEGIRDDEGVIYEDFVDLVRERILAADHDGLMLLAGDLHESDIGEIIELLETDERPAFVRVMGRDFDFAALTEIEDDIREELLEEIPNQQIAEGVRDLDSDDAVYIIEDLAEEDQEEVLAALPSLERVQIERSLDYPEGSAGRRMQSDLIAVPPFWTVGQTIDHLRETEDLPEQFYEIFVVDAKNHVVGRVALNRVLRSKRPTKIESIMDEADHVVQAGDDQEEVADLFKRYNLVSIPVTDIDNRLVGVLTFDDMVDLIDEQADAEIRAMGGVKQDETLSDSVLETAKSRFSWLFVNLLTAILASVVIGFFKGSLEKMVALAVLMPIVASQGGNAGTQTMTVAVRALATRALLGSTARKFVLREVLVGLMNGVAFAAIMALVAAFWFQSPELGGVIAVAIIVTLAAAGLAGVLIPLALERAGVDPAVASGPFVTTVTDIVGFFAFLGTATLWFGLG
jgi:magnesium transporter